MSVEKLIRLIQNGQTVAMKTPAPRYLARVLHTTMLIAVPLLHQSQVLHPKSSMQRHQASVS